jgi:murein peptide amidase A
MKQPLVRHFDDIVDRLRASLNPVGELIEVDTLSAGNRDYPLIKIVLGKGNPRRILISGGIHGDEPAGVETICAFLENQLYKDFLENWEFTLLPCINPSGFETGTRNTRDGIDLNRKFNEEQEPREVTFVKNILDQPYELDLELHEDSDSNGYYLYQKDQSTDLSSLGRAILDRVESIHPLNLAEEIEEMPADRGLLSRLSEPDEMDWWPMALYAYTRGCSHIFTLETSPALPMDIRVKAHLLAIQTALEQMKGKET